MAGIVEHPTKASLVYVCTELLRQFKRGNTLPRVNGVTMEHASIAGYCQQAVREAVEATVYGAERLWVYASCCAGQTARRLKAAGFGVPRAEMQSGDLVYFGGGGACRTCGNPVGHTGIWAGDGLWQNTSAHSPHFGVWPVTDAQWERLLGVFSILPAAIEDLVRVVSLETNQVIGTVPTGGLHVEDQRKVYCWPV